MLTMPEPQIVVKRKNIGKLIFRITLILIYCLRIDVVMHFVQFVKKDLLHTTVVIDDSKLFQYHAPL